MNTIVILWIVIGVVAFLLCAIPILANRNEYHHFWEFWLGFFATFIVCIFWPITLIVLLFKKE